MSKLRILAVAVFAAFLIAEEGYGYKPAPFPPPNTCGLRQFGTIMDRIVGGTEARWHEYPWQVRLAFSTVSNPNGICGGVIVSKFWVLTAAHCCENANGPISLW